MTTQHSDTIELGYVARTISRNWRAVAAFTLLGIAAATLIILFAPRKYTGVTTVILKSGGPTGSSVLSQVTGLGDITAGLLGGKSPMETEIEVLSSRSVVGSVVDSLRMQVKLEAGAPIAAKDIVARVDAPGAFRPQKIRFHKTGEGRYRFSSEEGSAEMVAGAPAALTVGTITFTATARLPAEFEILLRDRNDAIEWVTRHLDVEKQKGEVASITYKGDDPVTAAALPNALLDAYFGRRQGTDRGINQRRVEFLTAKSDSMERALVLASQTLRRQQEASGILDPEAVAKVELESAAELRTKLTDVLVEQGALKQLVDQITAGTLSPREMAAYPRFINSPVINNLVAQLSDFETRRTVLLASHAETDRDVVALDKSAAAVEAKILPYARTYAEALARQRTDIEAALSKVEAGIGRLPRAAESNARLENNVEALTKLFAGLQGQIVEAKLAAIGEGGDVRPLDRAEIPKRPSFPNPVLTAGLGTVGGLFCGLVAALLLGSVGRWVRDPVEIERATGVAALQFDPAVPLLLSNGVSRTILLAPTEPHTSTTPVANRLAQTAASRSIPSVVLDLSATAPEVNTTIARLEDEHELVIVQLPSLDSDTAAAALQHGRPVLLVTPGRRTDRRRLISAVQLLKRLDVPVAGIVMNDTGINGRSLKA